MKELEEYPSFIRPHRAYIVNMDFIRKLTAYEMLLTNGKRIPVPQSSYGKLKNAYLDYMMHI